MRRLFRHSVRHRVYEIGARTRAHGNRLERAGSTTWCGTHTSEAADAVFVMLMHSLLTPHLPACNETIYVSRLSSLVGYGWIGERF